MSTPPTTDPARESTLRHLLTSVLYTVVTVIALGLLYPLLVWGLATLLFHHQAHGSLIESGGKVVGSELVGQAFTKPQYFHGRPSAAGKGYDPTATGGTNLGPTSKKLIDATRSTLAALKKENPAASGPVPMDLVTSSASGIDPDISPEGAYYQAARVAKVRGLALDAVRAQIAAHVTPRQFGILGEPRVNVLELNRALDAQGVPAK
ncbi:MAG: potassium-transporting ATPase KdpC subunit [Candidatus Eremiobacteraeota bacterium]|jgi:K+-transporting ATPase ATPase C chain|nr:potassium-transporting ATPase KdpC subunit [Candidatus Eremiobacteraeota bacterium]